MLWINIVCAIIPAVMAIMVFFFPDSPRWHLSKNHNEEAHSALKVFRGTSDVDSEIQTIKQNLEEVTTLTHLTVYILGEKYCKITRIFYVCHRKDQQNYLLPKLFLLQLPLKDYFLHSQ